MDLATDILRLADKVGLVPGLTIVYKLVMQILQTVQVSKRNTARLQYLAHLVAESLVAIAENMESKWDDAPAALKTKLDEYEAILHDVWKAVKRRTSSSAVISFFNAGDRDFDITMLEKRLTDTQRSILLYLGVDASLALQSIRQSVNSQQAMAHATYCAVSRLEGVNRLALGGDDPDIHTYTREDVQILETIGQYDMHRHPQPDSATTAITVKLHKAERYDNRIFLIRTYHNVPSTWKAEAFTRDLSLRRQLLDPLLLQLVGASRATATIPFQVFHFPGGLFQPYVTWVKRTLSFNPVEAVYGLLKMRTSIWALDELEKSQPFSLGGSNLAELAAGFYVSVQPGHQWKLIYAGELSSGPEFRKFPPSMWLPWPGDNTDPAIFIGEMILRASLGGERGDDIEDILRCHYDEITLPMLGAALFERGWVRESSLYIHPIDAIALGDIGYVTEGGNFVVVDNMHHRLQEHGSLWDGKLEFKSGWKFLDDAPAEEIISERGNVYYRRRLCALTIPANIYMSAELRYKKLDEPHAYKLLQRDAHSIIAHHRLPIAPHDLRFVIRINLSWATFLEALDGPLERGDVGNFEWGSHVDAAGTGNPTVYAFTDNNTPNTGNPGAPELMTKFRTSFQPQPEWLDEARWYDWEALASDQRSASTSEVKDDLRLRSTQWNLRIRCLQLPIGAAEPFITEVEE